MMDTPPQASKEMKEYLRKEIDRMGGHDKPYPKAETKQQVTLSVSGGASEWLFSEDQDSVTIEHRDWKREAQWLADDVKNLKEDLADANKAVFVLSVACILLFAIAALFASGVI